MGSIETVSTARSGRTWVRLLDQEAATEEGNAMEHAAGTYFSWSPGKPDWKFFSLRGADGERAATVLSSESAIIVAVTQRNGPPGPDLEPDIRDLAEHLGFTYEPAPHYPYCVEPPAADAENRPAFG
jgi:hypothetical protein